MKFLLDTDICSYLAQGKPSIVHRLSILRSDEWGISSLTEYELQKGVQLKQVGPWVKNTTEFLKYANVLPFSSEAAHHSGIISADLKSKGKPSGLIDELIAGHAISLGATLVTNNQKHFIGISNLRVENWL
jgi:tRNA(fMet)-specific endonuclease VapC